MRIRHTLPVEWRICVYVFSAKSFFDHYYVYILNRFHGISFQFETFESRLVEAAQINLTSSSTERWKNSTFRLRIQL